MTFHPFAEEYPLLPAKDLARLTAAMKARGFDPRFPVVLYQGKVLDGRNRVLAATEAGVEAPAVTFEGDDDAARAFVETANEDRRHLTLEWLAKRRAERVKRIVNARAEGASIRTIAEAEGVSVTQVQRDVQEGVCTTQGVPPGTPDTNSNGHQQVTSTAPEPLCDRCRRVGKAKDCPKCAELLAPGKPAKPAGPKVTGRDGKSYAPGKPKAPRTGKVKFDDRKVKDHFGKLARLLNDRAQALALQKSKGWADVREKLEHLLAAWDRWQLESTK
jgi:hypothetical protein